MSEPNANARSPIRVCQCGKDMTGMSATAAHCSRKCRRKGEYSRMTPERRRLQNQSSNASKSRRRKVDQMYRDHLSRKRRGQRERAAIRQGRVLGVAYKISFDELQDRLAYRNARQAWVWWLNYKAPRQWLEAYFSQRPWRMPGLTDAERYRLRYMLDAAFYAREYARLQAKKRRHRQEIASAPGGLTDSRMRRIRERSALCAYCRCRLTPTNRSVDHVVALSKGGTHDESNVVACCIPCNSAKKDSSVETFLAA